LRVVDFVAIFRSPSETRAVTRGHVPSVFWGLPNCKQAFFSFKSRGSAFRGNARREGLITKHVVSAGTAKSALPTQQINTKE